MPQGVIENKETEEIYRINNGTMEKQNEVIKGEREKGKNK